MDKINRLAGSVHAPALEHGNDAGMFRGLMLVVLGTVMSGIGMQPLVETRSRGHRGRDQEMDDEEKCHAALFPSERGFRRREEHEVGVSLCEKRLSRFIDF